MVRSAKGKGGTLFIYYPFIQVNNTGCITLSQTRLSDHSNCDINEDI